MSDDDDKTVFGQSLPVPPLPRQGQGQQDPTPGQGARQPAPPQSPVQQPPSADDRTQFGQPLPPEGAGSGRVGPAWDQPQPPQKSVPPNPPPLDGQAPGHAPGPPRGAPPSDDTWLGGVLSPQTPPRLQPEYRPPQGQPQQPAAPPPQYPGYQQPLYQPGAGQRPPGSEIFPDIPRAEPQAQRMDRPRIALADALRATGLGAGGPTNPLIAAAANLLILLGRLRTGLVEMQAGPLIDHVAREIDLFERNSLAAGASQMDVHDAKYALSATADDIVQNLPGADRGDWLQYSMVARFFGDRNSGVVFFQKMDEAMRAPAQHFHLLELMLTCLSLGFEGQYRAMGNGGVELANIRTAIYETLRRVQPRPDDDISPNWTPVEVRGHRRRGGPPVWVVASVAASMIVALFATLSTLLTHQGAIVRDEILALHAGAAPITIERTEPVAPDQGYQAPQTSQLERIRAALAPQIEAGEVEVDRKGDFISVRVGDHLRFRSGSADLDSDFVPLATAIANALNAETGEILVVGHTDSIPPSGRGRYKTNEDLSVARAQTVADILSKSLTDATRVVVAGKGAVDPIATNDTAEGRARNRRVEIMTPREG